MWHSESGRDDLAPGWGYGVRIPLFARRARLSVMFLGLLLAGCASVPSPEDIRERIDAYTDRGGYRATEHYTVVSLRETWRHDRIDLDISFLAPREPGRYPLIVYLPGIGATAESGDLWRQAWAEAGYAVLAIQPVAVSQALLSSYRLHSGDLRAIGRQLFAARSLQRRLGHVAWAFGELMRRSERKVAPFTAADPNRVAVAGFELGAQAAVRTAGEPTASAGELVGLPIPRAAIALSPYFPVAEGRSAKTLSEIHVPLLTVTGSEDEDPYGITPVALRTDVWKEMPVGEKFLLWLQGGQHGTLAGTGVDRTDPPAARLEEESPAADDMPDPPSVGSTHAFPGGGPGAAGPGARGPRPDGPARPPNYRHLAIVRSVSLAFLDYYTKDRSEALTWLKRDAVYWMGRSARLQRK